MKTQLLFIAAGVFLTVLPGTGWAIENPIGPATLPPSSIRSGLVRSPNPIDTSGNLIITGNVRAGRHFRGIVPYGATSDFRAGLGSSSLDSFLRDSAGSENFSRYTSRYKPYYSQTGTVTTTRPGRPGIFRPTTTRIGGRAADRFALGGVPKGQGLSGRDTAIPNIKLKPMRFSPQELEKLILEGVPTYAQAKRLADEQNLAQTERFRQDLKQLRLRPPQLRQSLIIRDDSLRPFTKLEQSRDVSGYPSAKGGVRGPLQPVELQRPKEQAGEDKQPDVYEQMKQQLNNLQKRSEQLPAITHTKEAADDKKKPDKEQDYLADSGPILQKAAKWEPSQMQKSAPGASAILRKTGIQKSSLLDELSDADLSARAKAILDPYKTFASFSKDKFNQYIRAAEEHLKQGRYYRAADAYSLASIYKPGDPLSFAGKSHALFAAGEYMSSALFLARALKIYPEYARFKIDLVAMVGNKDMLESRIADVEQWLQRSSAGELQFLLGYVYYQMGRLQRAKEAIDAAYEKMPESPAVDAVKKAIDDAIKS